MTIPDEENEDSDVVAERKRALDPNFFPALKIVNMRKVYKNWGAESDKVAVRNSNFVVEEGKLLALLGQNGAGKSTTISMLSGLTPASSGDALIYNLSVKDSILSIRKIMGICPQHDILFDDLTAREHIQLYAGLKGVPENQWEPLIKERLHMVRLLTVADVRAGTYSGGYFTIYIE
jgi:ABC-type multidrug transport system ATPase subunit